MTRLNLLFKAIKDMLEIKEREDLRQKSNIMVLETRRAPAEQMLVETLLPWWSKLVLRIVVTKENVDESKDNGGVDNVKDQRVAL